MKMKCFIMKLDIISSSANKRTSNSCIVYIVSFSGFLIINLAMAI